MAPDIPRPPFDAETHKLIGNTMDKYFRPETILTVREAVAQISTLESVLDGNSFSHVERSVPSPDGPPVKLSIFTPSAGETGNRPCIYFMHSGGMVIGNQFTGFKDTLDWGEAANAVVVSVDYRLAPEDPYPAAINDCWAGLNWVHDNATELGIDTGRIMVAGQSAGGLLATALVLMARDKGGPKIAALLVDTGMLDDRGNTNSAEQFTTSTVTLDRLSNDTCWDAHLGKLIRGSADLPIYASPARAEDFSGFPTTYVDCGASEYARDDNIGLAQKLWKAGVECELHVWTGGPHGFHVMAPNTSLSREARRMKTNWTRRILVERE